MIGQGKKTSKRVPVYGSHYCKTWMDDIRVAEAMWNTWREKPEADETTMPAAIARIEQPSTFGANFSRASGISTREESKGCARLGRIDVSSSRLFANFGNIRSSSPSVVPLFSPSPPPLPIVAMNRLSHP